ncbi:MAG: ACT domain-containing protein [Anaerolineales bacterium]|nr:ACT domain-containing protein [Anaerolineales bacterium]
MSGETNLQSLLANMQPDLLEGEFVFCSISPQAFAQLRICPIGNFREAEGITLIVERSIADAEGLDYEFVSRMITLNIHSSLEAVGFLASVTSKLAEAGISANPVSAFYHDHLFVPTDRASAAMRHLDELRNVAAGHISDS